MSLREKTCAWRGLAARPKCSSEQEETWDEVVAEGATLGHSVGTPSAPESP